MKIDELIEELEAVKQEHGNQELLWIDLNENDAYGIKLIDGNFQSFRY